MWLLLVILYGGDDAEGDELGLDDLAHVRLGDDPLRRVGHRGCDVLKRVPTIGLLGYPIEQLRDLEKVPVTLDEPLSILERRLLHFADELDVRCSLRILGDCRRR